jgi:iron complex outermembrane receptor protein
VRHRADRGYRRWCRALCRAGDSHPLPGATCPARATSPDDFRVKTNAFALFTHNIIHLTDKLSLTLGARYNHETKDHRPPRSTTIWAACAFFNQVRAGDPAAVDLCGDVLRGASPALFNNLFLLELQSRP